jgi:RNA polymerase sigma-70 factor (ECF subfamily)
MSAAAIDPFVLRQAEIRASRIVGATGYMPDDWEDLRQELLLDYVRRQPRFDPARGDRPVARCREFRGVVAKNSDNESALSRSSGA